MRARLPSYDLRLKKEKHCDKVWNTTWLLLERKQALEDGLLKKGWLRHIGSKKNSVVRLLPFLPMLRVVTHCISLLSAVYAFHRGSEVRFD